MTTVSRSVVVLLRGLLGPPIGPEIAREVQSEQVKLLWLAGLLFATAGTGSVALLAWDFRRHLSPVAIAAVVSIYLCYGLLVLSGLGRATPSGEKRFVRVAVVILAALGTIWGVLLNLLLVESTLLQRGLIDGLVVALVSTPLIAAPISAAAAFWLPSACLGTVLFARSSPFDPYPLALFCGYLAFTAAAIVLWNRFAIERSIGRIVQERQNQTIEVFLKSYQEGASDWLWETDEAFRLRRVSPRLDELIRAAGLPPGIDTLPAMVADDRKAGGRGDLLGPLRDREAFRDLPLRVGAGASTRWWSLTGRPIENERGEFKGYRGVGSDITDIRRAEQQVRFLALHDSLTGLANRAAFTDELAHVCGRAGEADRGLYALLLLDLDRFKSVNDTLGHPAGDELLRRVSDRLRDASRATVALARLGGDEFGVIAPVRDEDDAAAVARGLVATVVRPYRLGGLDQTIGVSIGIAMLTGADCSPSHAMQQADIALYAAKEDGSGQFRFFEPLLLGRSQGRLEVLRALEAAVRDGSMHLAFQPIVDLERGAVVTVEALCRWTHPRLGTIPPSTFIPLAEESGLILELGLWALLEASRAALRWPPHVRIAINVSPRQIKAPGFERQVRDAIASTGLDPARVDLEMTEHAYLNATDGVLDTLRGLREAGCHLVLDDFGAGHSALSYLTAFTFDAIKLDAGFLQGIDTNPVKASIVRLVVELAREMALPVTMEGIETEQQRALVTGLRIRYGQGYALGRPMGRSEIGRLLEAGRIAADPAAAGRAASLPASASVPTLPDAGPSPAASAVSLATTEAVATASR